MELPGHLMQFTLRRQLGDDMGLPRPLRREERGVVEAICWHGGRVAQGWLRLRSRGRETRPACDYIFPAPHDSPKAAELASIEVGSRSP